MTKKTAHDSYSSSSESSHSSDSSDSETEFKIKINKKSHRKKSSSSESSKKSSKKCSKKSSKKCSNKSDSDSDFEHYCFDDVYKYYKYKLLEDNNLMIAGSDAWLTAYNNTLQTIPAGYQVNFNAVDLSLNCEHLFLDAPFVVRKSGIYILFFIISVDQASQFTLFINGVVEPLTTTGNNAGSGQTISRLMLSLNENDTLIFRNYISSASALTSSLYIGGLQPGNNHTFLLFFGTSTSEET